MKMSVMRTLTLTATEQKRLQVLAGVLEGRLKVTEASGLMGVSDTHGDYWQHSERKELLP